MGTAARGFGFVMMVLVLLGALLVPLPMGAGGDAPAATATMGVVAGATGAAPAFTEAGARFAGGWGLRLAALGRGDALAALAPVVPTDDGRRVEYRHAGATEWYVRDGNGGGIEQGVTLGAPPVGAGPLALMVDTGGAIPLVDANGAGATLVLPTGTGGGYWRYDGLRVTDATGRVLPARLSVTEGGLGITAEDAGAVYPVTVDPFVRRQSLADPGNTNGDSFGVAVALSGDGLTLAVGAYGTNSYKGAVYVYRRVARGLFPTTPLTTLADPGNTGNDSFGYAVALSADGATLAVGAVGTSSYRGAAYVYTDPPTLTVAGGSSQSATVGTAFAAPLSVLVADDAGNPRVGASVAFTAPAANAGATGTFPALAGSVTVTTDTNGVATAPAFTANNVEGSYAVTASTTNSGGTTSVALNLANTAATAASITALSGTGQSAQIGSAFAAPLRVQVRDASGNTVPGTTVTFTAPTGANAPSATFGGSATTTVTTDSAGIASVSATAAGRPGLVSVVATIPGGATTSFTLTDTASPATLTLTGFSPSTGPTSGGNVVTIRGTNFSGATAVTFDTTPGTAITLVNSTTITVTAPAHAAGTVDITVTTGGQTGTIHGYTYLTAGSITTQPGLHPLPGGGSGGGGMPLPQPVRHDPPGGSGGGTGAAPQGAGQPTATPAPQPARH